MSDEELLALAKQHGIEAGPSDEELLALAEQHGISPDHSGFFTPGRNYGKSMVDSFIQGHAPNAIEPTTAAELMAPAVMGAPGMQSVYSPSGAVAGVTRSASMSNLPTAIAARGEIGRGLLGAAQKAAPYVMPVAKKAAGMMGAGGLFELGRGLLRK